ncbi:uncharacterized protein DUF3857 [Tenacibaculum lutimaris]|uniref:Uncharacterized protein DUF3857 n=1 Tax=Tenacibaculum lutimaris TaxID=285258 RepID=A0A420E3X7_9FLAO|nr:DUF3857 domain-containing protein [Tenacibaculum lutimaris]RKF04796.1 uncharacterized protein DUF3857 [Tenacibaculum lutimaris]
MKKALLLFTLIFIYNLNAQETKFGKVSKEELEESIHPIDSTADAAYLLKNRRTYFKFDQNNGFQVITDYHERIKVYTKEGLEYATKKIIYYKPETGEVEKITSLKAYTFNLENGKIVEQKPSKKDIFDIKLNKYRSQKKITFANVKEGSIIDIKYTLISPYYDIRTLNFQYGIPVKQLNTQIEIPEYFVFSQRAKGFFNITPKQTSKEGSINWTSKTRHQTRSGMMGHSISTEFSNHTKKFILNVYNFNDENILPLKENEPFSGNINNYRGGLEFELSGTRFPNSMYENYATDWKSVCKTIYNSSSFGAELEKTNYFKEDITNLVSITKNDIDKIALIFQFVKSKVKWNEYYGKFTEKGVKKAYKEGVGNVAEINLMLTSMLQYTGFDANPVLTSTRDNGVSLFPTSEGFNYVISKVNLPNGKYILLDATEALSDFNILPFRTLNWYGTEILENGNSQQVKLIPSTLAEENNILHIKIDELGEVSGMLRKSLKGHSAMFYRQKNNLKKEEDLINSIEDKYDIEIEDFKILNKENLSKPIVQNLKFSGEDFIEEVNDKLYLSPLLFLATKESPFKSKERSFPIDFGMPWQDQNSVSIIVPESYSIESYPDELAIGLPDNLGVFKYKVTVQNNKIKLFSVTQFNSNIIAPQHYLAVKDLYNQLIKKQTEKIVLTKI